MPVKEREIKVTILGEDRGGTKALKDLAAAGEKAEGGFDRLGSKGVTLTKTLTPAAAGVGLAFRAAWQEFDTGSDTIIAKTGASGEALKGLEGTMRKVSGGVRTGMGDIGAVVGDLNTALGITGQPLTDLTTKVVKLQELGESLDPMTFTRFLGDWSIPAEDAGDALDRLYKVAQVTGIGVQELADQATAFGAPMRALGFDAEQTTLLLGKWTKEGVNVETVLASMKSALGKFAKAGEDPKESLQNLIDTMKGFGTDAEAMALAAELVGVKTGPDLAMAIREGRFDIDQLAESLGDTTSAIDTAHKATIDWSDKLGLLRNKVFAAIGPIGEVGMGVAGLAAGIGPAMMGISKIGPALASGVSGAAAFGASMIAAGISAVSAAIPVIIAWAPVILTIAAVIAIGVLLWQNWDTIKEVAGAAWGAITETVGGAAAAVGGFLTGLVDAVVGFAKDWGWVLLGPVGAAWHFRDEIFGVVTAIGGFLSDLIGGVVNFAQEWGWVLAGPIGFIWHFRDEIRGALDSVIDFVAGMPGRIAGAARGMWDGISSAFKSAINSIIRGWNSIQFRIPGFSIGPISFGGFTLGLPNIPYLAKGGIATTAGLAIVGEAGPELAFMSKGAGIAPLSSMAGTGAGGGHGSDRATAKAIAAAVEAALGPLVAKLSAAGMTINMTEKADPMHIAREIAWAMG